MLSIKSWRLQPGVLIIGNLAEVRLPFDGDIYGADVGGGGDNNIKLKLELEKESTLIISNCIPKRICISSQTECPKGFTFDLKLNTQKDLH